MVEFKQEPALVISSASQDTEALVLYAREQRATFGIDFALLLVWNLASVLERQKREKQKRERQKQVTKQVTKQIGLSDQLKRVSQRQAICLNTSDMNTFLRAQSRERLLFKELGIWCYLSYIQGACDDFLVQAERCLKCVCDLYGSDIETEKYLSFVLWSKWQIRKAQPGDMARCFTLLSHCIQADPLFVSQLDAVWFRLGYLYQIGLGCTQNREKASFCFEQARQLGLDC